MDFYKEKWEKLQEEFHDVMHEYPLFSETIEEIEEHELKEINELLEKHDEFYFKKAISKLEDLISYIKKTSTDIEREYTKFDKLASIWEKITIHTSEKELNRINDKVRKANELIKSHRLKDLIEANKIMEALIKEYE